jgi:hypothetical protein
MVSTLSPAKTPISVPLSLNTVRVGTTVPLSEVFALTVRVPVEVVSTPVVSNLAFWTLTMSVSVLSVMVSGISEILVRLMRPSAGNGLVVVSKPNLPK